MHQSNLMLKLRIKIDSWSQGVDEAIRKRNRTLLVEEYMNLPCRRFWLYLRHWRFMVLTDGKPWLNGDALSSFQGGMEDELTYRKKFYASVVSVTDQVSVVYDSLPSVVLNRFMYDASMMDQGGRRAS